MSLDAKFELKIDGGLVMEIRVHPDTHPHAISDILEDATTLFRNGFKSMMTDGDSGRNGEQHEPPPVEWTFYNYNPETPETEALHPSNHITSPDGTAIPADRSTGTKPERNFYGEQPLIGEIPYTINGIPAVTINYHPAMGIGEIADILEDGAKDLRKELENRNPLIYDPDTVTLTVPAMHVGKALTNLMDSYSSKLAIALEMEDYEAADVYFGKSEKLYEWMCRNYTPEAVKNNPDAQQLSARIESFKGIKQHKKTD